MVKVIATSRGYFGGEIRDPGTASASFNLPDEIWKDEKRRPSWVKLDPSKAFGGKGDHDGDGSVGGSKPQADSAAGEASPSASAGPVVPPDWANLKPAERKALAAAISGSPVKNAAEADKLITEYVEGTKPAPFGDAPEPETIKGEGNGVAKALGSVEPDWLPPGGGEPSQVE